MSLDLGACTNRVGDRAEGEIVEFWEARTALLTAAGGYANLHLLYANRSFLLALRRARAGQLSRAELDQCIADVAARDMPKAPPVGIDRISLVSIIRKAEADGSV